MRPSHTTTREPSRPTRQRALRWGGLLLAALVAAPASSQVTLYRDVGFAGRAETFHGAIPDLGRTAIGNDRASAVEVAPGCVATLFEHVDFRGRAITVDGSIADLRRTALGNDRASSLDVRCARGPGDRDRFDRRRDNARWDDDRHEGRHDRSGRNDRGRHLGWERGRGHRGGEGVVLFRDAHFRDPRLELRGSVADLGRTPLGNDRLSSIRVPPGCSAVVYEHAGFRGRALEVRHDLEHLGRTPIGNDRVSSIEVFCR
ncbi:MAG TPA: hypothetical protein VMV46_20990 [Thermoanaerobaculia bacterium]|nr:hypothetical protein [Thermoanaerobaculia bacterium]